MAKTQGSLVKHQQIYSTNKTMFVWVTAASVVISISLVMSYAIFQRMSFNQKVIAEKNTTVSNLDYNNSVVEDLNAKIRVLNSNELLKNSTRNDDLEPVSAVLDALPSVVNSTALGSSLQDRILDIPGVRIETLNVEAVSGVEEKTNEGQVVDPSGGAPTSENEIAFQFELSSTGPKRFDNMKTALTRLEKSIRPFGVSLVEIEQSKDRVTLKVRAVSYYSPEKKVELGQKVVKP
jgi:hypothetical protein